MTRTSIVKRSSLSSNNSSTSRLHCVPAATVCVDKVFIRTGLLFRTSKFRVIFCSRDEKRIECYPLAVLGGTPEITEFCFSSQLGTSAPSKDSTIQSANTGGNVKLHSERANVIWGGNCCRFFPRNTRKDALCFESSSAEMFKQKISELCGIWPLRVHEKSGLILKERNCGKAPIAHSVAVTSKAKSSGSEKLALS